MPLIRLREFKRNWNLFHQSSVLASVPDSYGQDEEVEDMRLEARNCDSDRLSWEIGRVSILLPPLMHELQRYLIAARLRKSLLRNIPPLRLPTIAEAITSPSVQWTTDYQRLEFLGDAVLKYAVCIQLFHDYPLWPEGELTQYKAHLVSNISLTDAVLRAGLEKYIFVKVLMARKWTDPTLTTAKSLPATPEREFSVKMAADVLEALIGAAYVDGGMSLAWSMIHLFFPSVVKDTRPSISSCPDENLSPIPIAPACLDDHIDSLVGYHFTGRSLIWQTLTPFLLATRHVHGIPATSRVPGHALLDLIVNQRVFAHTHPQWERAQ